MPRFYPGDWLLLLLVAALLGAAWPGLAPPSFEVAGALNAAGRAAGIAGLALLLLAGLLSIRLPGADRLFGGLTRVWKIHHIAGWAALLLLLAHPLLLAFALLPMSAQAPTAMLFPREAGLATWLGWGALLVMLIFLAPTFGFFGRVEYQRWKRIHRLSGAALLLAVAHTVLLTRSLEGPVTGALWAGLAVAGLAAYLYRTTLAARVARQPYQVAGTRRYGADMVELTLRPDAGRLAYRPGQFVYLTFEADGLAAGRGEEHPYTLSSAPHEPDLRVVIKALGDASRAVQALPAGSRAWVDGPYGGLFDAMLKSKHPCPAVWVGGGIGITPFLSGARHMLERPPGAPVDLFYAVNGPAQAYFLEELTAIAARVPQVRVHAHYFDHEGPLSADYIAARCPDLSRRAAYLCGPVPMIAALRPGLRQHGVPRRRIYSEEFSFLP